MCPAHNSFFTEHIVLLCYLFLTSNTPNCSEVGKYLIKNISMIYYKPQSLHDNSKSICMFSHQLGTYYSNQNKSFCNILTECNYAYKLM